MLSSEAGCRGLASGGSFEKRPDSEVLPAGCETDLMAESRSRRRGQTWRSTRLSANFVRALLVLTSRDSTCSNRPALRSLNHSRYWS